MHQGFLFSKMLTLRQSYDELSNTYALNNIKRFIFALNSKLIKNKRDIIFMPCFKPHLVNFTIRKNIIYYIQLKINYSI